MVECQKFGKVWDRWLGQRSLREGLTLVDTRLGESRAIASCAFHFYSTKVLYLIIYEETNPFSCSNPDN